MTTLEDKIGALEVSIASLEGKINYIYKEYMPNNWRSMRIDEIRQNINILKEMKTELEGK